MTRGESPRRHAAVGETVHTIRYYASPDANRSLIETSIPNRLGQHRAWEGGERGNEPPGLRPANGDAEAPIEGVEFYDAIWRFVWNTNRTTLLRGIEQPTAEQAPWYRIGYHICDHASDDREGCAWNIVREGGDVPDYVPVLEVDPDNALE